MALQDPSVLALYTTQWTATFTVHNPSLSIDLTSIFTIVADA